MEPTSKEERARNRIGRLGDRVWVRTHQPHSHLPVLSVRRRRTADNERPPSLMMNYEQRFRFSRSVAADSSPVQAAKPADGRVSGRCRSSHRLVEEKFPVTTGRQRQHKGYSCVWPLQPESFARWKLLKSGR